MIWLTRLSGDPFVLNSDLIERIDSTPDTVITLGDGTKYVAAEDLDTVITSIRLHRAEIIALSAVVQVSDPRDSPPLASVTDLVSSIAASGHGNAHGNAHGSAHQGAHPGAHDQRREH